VVSKADCERAVYNGAEWYCVWCESWYDGDEPEVVHEHDVSTDNPLCGLCDADMVAAERAYEVE